MVYTYYIQVEYRCESQGHVGTELRVWTDTHENALVFYDVWTCSPHATKPLRKKVKILLPESLAFKPSVLNTKLHVVNKTVLRAWIIDAKSYSDKLGFLKNKAYRSAKVKVSYKTRMKSPLERESQTVSNCLTWSSSLRLKLPYTPTCKDEICKFNITLSLVILMVHGFCIMSSCITPNMHYFMCLCW